MNGWLPVEFGINDLPTLRLHAPCCRAHVCDEEGLTVLNPFFKINLIYMYKKKVFI